MTYRIETDAVGTLAVPADAYYGAQTLRAMENFPISGRTVHPQMIVNLARVKKAAAFANMRTGALDTAVGNAIAQACDEVIAGGLRDAFPVDGVQGGAGTSANMNLNEVLANRALELLGEEKGNYARVHPNDHVNLSQSTNDAYPTAGRLTVYDLTGELIAALSALREALMGKALLFDDVIKMGRTQLQDAVPIRLGQEFSAYAAAVGRDIARIARARTEMLTINLGGTAIGTAINAPLGYLQCVTDCLREMTGTPLTPAEDLVDATQNADAYAAVSAALKICALSLSKICNDLRLLSSGPRAGLGEITLPVRQNGSSIMPGKINPVIPEVVTQVAFRVAGNDTTISMAVEAGQLELNAFEPMIFLCLFESSEMLTHAVQTLNVHCVSGIQANRERCLALVHAGTGVVTALCPLIGYQRAAALAHEALVTGVSIQELATRETGLSREAVERLLDARKLTINPLEARSAMEQATKEII